MASWYCKLAGNVSGPFGPEQLRALADTGRLSPQTEVRQGTAGPWTQLGQLAELTALIDPPTEPQVHTVSPAAVKPRAGAQASGQRAALRRPPPAPRDRPPLPRRNQGPPKRVILATGVGAGVVALLVLVLLLFLLSRGCSTGEGGGGGQSTGGAGSGSGTGFGDGSGPGAGKGPVQKAGAGAESKQAGSPIPDSSPEKKVGTQQSGTSATPGEGPPAPPPEAVTVRPLATAPSAAPGDTADEIGGGGGGGGGDGNSLETRLSGARRKALLRSGGGTPESEEAVQLALKWLAAHQQNNGSWSFQHVTHPECNGQCENPGHNQSKIAATSLALLPFLGTGQTHTNGKYKRTIDMGLKYLVGVIRYEGKLGSLWDGPGTMYGHGLASIVLCEAYGMTHDRALREPAQAVVDFIVDAQDPGGGGWRYQPRMPGDTSVVGWQLMALKSAQMAELRVPADTLKKTGFFLDSVQSDDGTAYGYIGPETGQATTAIGLLCRMYLGWSRDVRALEGGVQVLGTLGPATDSADMYYNYYATQVMHHWGGNPWKRWNAVMRDYLVGSQSRHGHKLGSWYFDGGDRGSNDGGRLYYTAMAAMILEVYYRHMPLYRKQLVSD